MWINFGCEIFFTVRQEAIMIFFLKMHCIWEVYQKLYAAIIKPNLYWNAVSWDTQPSACIAGRQVNKKESDSNNI